MATKAKLREWQRKADGSPTPPIMQPPRVQDFVTVKNPETKENWDRYDTAVEEWWKSLNLRGGNSVDFGKGSGTGGGGGSTVIPIPGGTTTPPPAGTTGEKGDKGDKGDPGLTEVLRTHVWIAKRTDGKAGSGVEHNPYDGSTYLKLDTLFRSFPEYTTIHLGPGVFETRGNAPGPIVPAVHWHVKSGWQIFGSGIGSTTLRLVQSDEANQYCWVIWWDASYDILHDVDIADLTLDANTINQPGTPACGCLSLGGNRITVSRVRCIGWGTKTTVWVEVFAFSLVGPGPSTGDYYNNIADGVIVDSSGQMTGPTDAVTLMAFGGVMNDRVWGTATLTRVGAVVTASLGAVEHELQLGQWFRVQGAAQTEYNGSFQVTEVVSATSLKYELVGAPVTPATGTITLYHPYDPTGRGQGFVHGLVVKNCHANGDGVFGGDYGGAGLTLGGTYGAVIQNNTFENLTAGYYQDSWRGGSVSFRGNAFRNVVSGFLCSFGVDPEIDSFLIESNIIELIPLEVDYGVGIHLTSDRTTRPMGFRNVIIRGNIIRLMGGADSAMYPSPAVWVRGADSVAILDNLIDLSISQPIVIFPVTNKVFARGNRSTYGDIILTHSNDGVPYFDPDIEADKIHKMALLE